MFVNNGKYQSKHRFTHKKYIFKNKKERSLLLRHRKQENQHLHSIAIPVNYYYCVELKQHGGTFIRQFLRINNQFKTRADNAMVYFRI